MAILLTPSYRTGLMGQKRFCILMLSHRRMILSNGEQSDPPDIFEQSFSRRTSSLSLEGTAHLQFGPDSFAIDGIGQLLRPGCGCRVRISVNAFALRHWLIIAHVDITRLSSAVHQWTRYHSYYHFSFSASLQLTARARLSRHRSAI
jgi:hypothetical protein